MPELENDPRVLGRRIAETRKARGKTQEEVADFLGYSTPMYIAIDKGERATKSDEIIKLASFFGWKVNELVRPGEPVTDLQPHLRAVADKMKGGDRNQTALNAAIDQLQTLAEDYRDLERIMKAPMRSSYPAEVVLNVKIDPTEQADVVAEQERKRLGLGGSAGDRPPEHAGVGRRSADLLHRRPPLEHLRNVCLLGRTGSVHPD